MITKVPAPLSLVSPLPSVFLFRVFAGAGWGPGCIHLTHAIPGRGLCNILFGSNRNSILWIDKSVIETSQKMRGLFQGIPSFSLIVDFTDLK